MSHQTVSKDTPLYEITLRKYEKPGTVEGRELYKKICLSLGLLQPGDSRDALVDVLQVIVESKKPLTMVEIEKKVVANRKKYSLPLHGVAFSNVTRQVRRLKQYFLVESFNGKYRVKENETLLRLFEEHILTFYLPSITSRIKEYLELLQKKE